MVIDWRNRIRRPRLAILLAVLGVVVAGYAVFFFMERHKFNLLLTDGKAMLAAREYATASELLERYLVGRPADTGARLLAARAARQTRAYADARVQRIYGGTNEIMKEVITRSMGLSAK